MTRAKGYSRVLTDGCGVGGSHLSGTADDPAGGQAGDRAWDSACDSGACDHGSRNRTGRGGRSTDGQGCGRLIVGDGRDRWCCGDWNGSGAGRRVDSAATGHDALPGTARAGVGVLLAGGVVGDDGRLELHDVRTGGIVCASAGPGYGAGGVRRVAGAPGADLDAHGRLGELAICAGGKQGADDLAVDGPDDLVSVPVDGVGVEGALAGGDGRVAAAIIGTGVALAEVICLHVCRI